jgi:pyruvate dehydrogenase E2 component (dihydrolipoamide acetyltransferase)
MFEFKFPDIGEGIADGEILRWLVKAGETIAEHQPLVEIETDKAVVELPSPVAGVVRELRGEVGDIVPVNAVLVQIETTEANQQEAAEKPFAVGVVGELEEAAQDEDNAGTSDATPAALPRDRKLAQELGVDLPRLRGSGPQGRISEADIRAAAAPETEPRDERIPLRGVRRTMAKTMAASAASTVHVTTMEKADAFALGQLLKREAAVAAERGLRLTWLPFIIKALTLVLGRFPLLNSSFDQENQEIIQHRQIHIGIAVDTPDGLLVPVLRNTRQHSILDLAAALQDLAARARERKITPAELKGGTFTVSNYGALGGLWGTPIINPPEVAILGVGRIEETPVVRDGLVVARPTAPLSLTFDHRIIDGATAHRFLNELIKLIEDPDLILLET